MSEFRFFHAQVPPTTVQPWEMQKITKDFGVCQPLARSRTAHGPVLALRLPKQRESISKVRETHPCVEASRTRVCVWSFAPQTSIKPKSGCSDKRHRSGPLPSAIKGLVQRHQPEAVSLQRLSEIEGTVIQANEIDEPLAETPPRLIEADWNQGRLFLTLDRPATSQWINA
jgi:hypothetical protein